MRALWAALFAMFALLFLAACSAVGVPATSDPARKVQQAAVLYDQQDRPLPAERLLREAIQIYSANGDQAGLAEAYRQYGFFFRSQAVENWAHIYVPHGFLDKSATFETRYAKSIEYFQRTANIFSALGPDYDAALSNVYFNMGTTYHLAGNDGDACSMLEKSRETNRRAHQAHPERQTVLPEGISSFDELIDKTESQIHCR